MKPVDENSNSHVSYHKDCSATFNKYKAVYYEDIKSSIGILSFALLLSACLGFFMFTSEDLLMQITLLLLVIGLPILPISNIIKAVSNIKARKIIIEKDNLVKTYGELELGQVVNWATFESHNKIALHGPKLQSLIKYSDTPVYIIKAGKTKEILDVVLIHEVELD